MTLIRVALKNDDIDILVNADQICFIEPNGTGSKIFMLRGHIFVKETIQQIEDDIKYLIQRDKNG